MEMKEIQIMKDKFTDKEYKDDDQSECEDDEITVKGDESSTDDSDDEDDESNTGGEESMKMMFRILKRKTGKHLMRNILILLMKWMILSEKRIKRS